MSKEKRTIFFQAPNSYTTRVHVMKDQWLIPFFDGSPMTEVDSIHTWFRVQIKSN